MRDGSSSPGTDPRFVKISPESALPQLGRVEHGRAPDRRRRVDHAAVPVEQLRVALARLDEAAAVLGLEWLPGWLTSAARSFARSRSCGRALRARCEPTRR